jgi:HlyD family secretion protein
MKKIMLITLLLCSLGVVLLGCSSQSQSATQNQIVTVQRGNLTVDITASGNLALSVMQDLAFDIPSGFNTTTKPLTVEEVLVGKGDSVEKGQVLVRLDASAWQDQLKSLEDAITSAERTVTSQQLTLLNMQISLISAQQNLEQAEGTSTTITGDTKTTTTTDPLQIKKLELTLQQAQGNLDAAQTKLEDYQTAVEDAQAALADAQNASPEVTAPFAGFITNVNVAGGDAVKKGTVAVTLADPSKFEASILVSEIDISNVKVGGAATVQPSAFSTVTLPATVTYISPTATIQSGVVNYAVTIQVQPLGTTQQTSQGQSAQLQRTPQGQGGQQQQTLTATPQAVQLKQGMTITVSVIVDQRTDVLLVPNGAITTRGRQTYVQVPLPDGTTEERAITTGISDWQYTEVTDGLSEGEQVVVPQGTTTTTTTTQRQQQPQQFIIPGGIGR